MIKIYIDDLIINSFIIYAINSKSPKRIYKLRLRQIIKYGNKIIDSLNKRKIETCLVTSDDLIEKFLDQFKDWFYLEDDEIIVLRSSTNIFDLINAYPDRINQKLLLEFNKKENYRILMQKD